MSRSIAIKISRLRRRVTAILDHDHEGRRRLRLGLKLDTARNRLGGGRISAPAASVAVWVVPTDEERMIARYASQTLAL